VQAGKGKYDVLRKYVALLKKDNKAYMVLHSLPGEEDWVY
jgi:hypothetical protein